MTVNTESNRITYQGNGSTTTFTFPFPGVAPAYIQVVVTDGLSQTIIPPSQYIIVLNAPIDPNPTSTGGTVTYPLVGSPLAVGSKISIIRSLPRIQPVSLSNQSIIYPPVIEGEFDYLTMISQQGEDILSRAFTVPLGDPSPLPVPTVALRAQHWAFFDLNGDLTAGDPPSGNAIISVAMQPVVSAATLAAARTAMGLGNIATFGIGLGLQDDGANKVQVNVPIQNISTDQVITKNFHNGVATTTGNRTFTLGPSASYFNGFGFYINVISGRVTFVVNAADMIQGLTSGVGWTLIAGTYAFIQTDGAGKWYFRYFQAPQATSAILTAASGSFAVPLGATRLLIGMCGGGGGGGSGTGGGNGGAGGATIFGNWSVGGGGAGQGNAGAAGGGYTAGGTSGGNGTGTMLIRIPGGDGGAGLPYIAPQDPQSILSGFGGGSFFGDGAGTTFSTNASRSATIYGGGGGGGNNGNNASGTGGGGGGGEYVQFIMNVVGIPTVAYNVGQGGGAASAGLGHAGVIFVTATYDQGPGA